MGKCSDCRLNWQGRMIVLGFFLICKFIITDQEVIMETLLDEDKEPYNILYSNFLINKTLENDI